MRHTKTLKVRIVLAALALMIGVQAIGATAAEANPVTIAKSGHTGFWAGDERVNVCMPFYIGLAQPYVTRTPDYPNYTQVVRLQSKIQYWNGSSWAPYKTTTWQERTMRPGEGAALFSQPSALVGGHQHYRVVQDFEWWIGNVRVGTVTNLFDQSSYQGFDGAIVARTGTAPSHCYIP